MEQQAQRKPFRDRHPVLFFVLVASVLFVITESLLATLEVLLIGPHFQWWSIAIPSIFFLVVMVIFALLIRNITSSAK